MLTPEANIIKLPNISASIPQLKAAIAELQAKGYAVPDYPEDPQTDEERDVLARYDKVLGSAVNPVLRQGNSDRRAPASVKHYAQDPPPPDGRRGRPSRRTNVAHMDAGDFRSTEQSAVMAEAGVAADRAGGRRRHHHRAAGAGPGAGRRGGRRRGACGWPTCGPSSTAQIARAKAEGVLFSVHLKATMMKVSDPIIFGHVVRAFFPETFAALRRRAGRRRTQPQRRAGAPSSTASTALPDGDGHPAPRSTPSWPPARPWPWSTPTGASPTCTCRAT